MRNLLLLSFFLFSLNASAKNAEVPKVLTQVFNDSTIYKYLAKYGGTDSLGYAVFENQGNYYIYSGSSNNKQSAMAQPYIGVVRKMKISHNRAKVRIHITNNNFIIKTKLSRTDSSQPWLVDSRLISNLFKAHNNQKRVFHYSKY